MEADPGDELAGTFGPFLRTLGVVLIACGLAVICAFIGSMTAPGVGALLGALGGFTVGALIGCCVMGKFRDWIDGDMVDSKALVPSVFHESVFGHERFTVYITVHKLTDAVHSGFGEPDFYIRVSCGKNPPKTTCVTSPPEWNETFKLIVEPTDSSVTFSVVDQNMLMDSVIGSASVPIKAIIEEEFPKGKRVKMQSKAKNCGVLHVSFRAGEGMSERFKPDASRCVHDVEYGSTGSFRQDAFFTRQSIPADFVPGTAARRASVQTGQMLEGHRSSMSAATSGPWGMHGGQPPATH